MKTMLIKRLLPIAAIMLVVIFVDQGTVMACPTCKDGLAHGQSNLVQGYFWSIVFMMSMPFLILGGLATYFYWEVCRARARAAAARAAEASHAFDAEDASNSNWQMSQRREPAEV